MKSVFITSRGGTHPIHRKYADSINADFQFVDFCLRWHDVKVPKWKKYASWVLCALIFPEKKNYDLFLVSGQHVMPVLMRILKRISRKQKLVCFHANEALYFIHSKKYKKLNRIFLRWILRQYDFHICVGEMQSSILRQLLKKEEVIYTIENGIPDEQLQRLLSLNPNLNSRKFLFIGNLYAGWRSWYKGVDLLIKGFLNFLQKSNNQNYTLNILGSYDKIFIESLINDIPGQFKNNICFLGAKTNVDEYLLESELYIHMGRGDAFPTATLEAFATGLPTILSTWTGTHFIIDDIDGNFVVEPKEEALSNAIFNYTNMTKSRRYDISKKLKIRMKDYSESHHVEVFKNTIYKIMNR